MALAEKDQSMELSGQDPSIAWQELFSSLTTSKTVKKLEQHAILGDSIRSGGILYDVTLGVMSRTSAGIPDSVMFDIERDKVLIVRTFVKAAWAGGKPTMPTAPLQFAPFGASAFPEEEIPDMAKKLMKGVILREGIHPSQMPALELPQSEEVFH